MGLSELTWTLKGESVELGGMIRKQTRINDVANCLKRNEGSWQEERHSSPVRQGKPGSEQHEIQEDGADI